MDKKGLLCFLVVILGIILFLYGANAYNNIVGWAGVYLFCGGILAYVILKIFEHPVQKSSDQNP
jgi:FtsH-binding integral membrane protein